MLRNGSNNRGAGYRGNHSHLVGCGVEGSLVVLSDGLQRLEGSPTQVPQVRQVSHHLHTHRSNSASFHPVLVLSSLLSPPPAFMKHLRVLNIMVCDIYISACVQKD